MGVGRESRNLSAHVNPDAVGIGHHRLRDRWDRGVRGSRGDPRPWGSVAGDAQLTTVLVHLLPDKGADLLLLPGMRRGKGSTLQQGMVQLIR